MLSLLFTTVIDKSYKFLALVQFSQTLYRCAVLSLSLGTFLPFFSKWVY